MDDHEQQHKRRGILSLREFVIATIFSLIGAAFMLAVLERDHVSCLPLSSTCYSGHFALQLTYHLPREFSGACRDSFCIQQYFCNFLRQRSDAIAMELTCPM
jgi:hypothetical protein